jgi:hypothetical protein
MVQLRSDRWYSRAGQRRSRVQHRPVGGGTRRLFSLAVLLVLVFWVMQKSADPKAYERIFRYLGMPLNATSTPIGGLSTFSDRRSAGTELSNESDSSTSIPKIGSQKDIGSNDHSQDVHGPEGDRPEGVKSSGPVASLTEVWDKVPWKNKDLGKAAQLSFATPDSELSGDQTDSRTVVEAAIGQVSWSSPDVELAIQIALTENRGAFRKWLDQRLLGQITDGSPWRGSENEVFYRLLQRADDWDRADADQMIVTSYPALRESVDLYRGTKWVRFRGWIEQAKLVAVKDDRWGFSKYWVVWLRPSDRSARPVVAYLTRVPTALATQVTTEWQGEIEVYGLPAKLVAYNAASGIELAPSLCGVASDHLVTTGTNDRQKDKEPTSVTAWILPILVAGFFSIAWVAWIWNRAAPQSSTEQDGSAEVGNKKKLTFVLGAKKSTDEKASLVWLALIGLASTSASPAQCLGNAYQDATAPPSQEEVVSEEVATTHKLLNERLTTETLFDIQHYASNEPTGLNQFPNSLGRLIYTADQVGNQRLRDLYSAQPALAKSSLIPSDSGQWKLQLWNGWVTGCDIITLTESQQEWMSQKHVYRLHVRLQTQDAAQTEALLFVRRAPSQWLLQPQLNQPFQAIVVEMRDEPLGVKIESPEVSAEPAAKSTPDSAVETPLKSRWGAAPNIQWVIAGPQQLAEMKPSLPVDWQRLAMLGSDLTWLDLAQSRQKLDLSFNDRDSFYKLLRIGTELREEGLHSSGHASGLLPTTLLPVKWTQIAGPELLDKTQDQWIGKAISIKGRIARISRVPIDSPVSRQIVKADAYYEMDGFIRIEGKRLIIPPPNQVVQQDSAAVPERLEDLVYENEFPMTLVALDIPDFLKEGSVDQGGVQHQSWELQRWVDVRGIFYRNWSYRSEYVSRGSRKERQMAPLVVAVDIVVSEHNSQRPDSPGQWVNWLALLFIVALLTVIWGFVFADWPRNKRLARKKTPSAENR